MKSGVSAGNRRNNPEDISDLYIKGNSIKLSNITKGKIGIDIPNLSNRNRLTSVRKNIKGGCTESLNKISKLSSEEAINNYSGKQKNANSITDGRSYQPIISNNNVIEIVKSYDTKERINTLNGDEEDQDLHYPCSQLLSDFLVGKQRALAGADNIAIINECIALGNKQIENLKSKSIEYKKTIAVLGNTGSGKSTFINYLCGHEMEKRKYNGRSVLHIKNSKNLSPVNDITLIGHSSKNSKTLIPNIVYYEEVAFIDCPGFRDSRGAAINISNAVNTKNILKNSQNLSIVVLINYHTLLADRARGLKGLIKILTEFFGGIDKIEEYKKSIKIGITHVSNGEQNGDFRSLRDIEKWMRADKEDPDYDMISLLSKNLFSFDPLDDPIEGGMSRKETLEELIEMRDIEDTQHLFKTSLLPEDMDLIDSMAKSITENVYMHISSDPSQLSIYNFENAALQIEQLELLTAIGIDKELDIHMNRIKDVVSNRLIKLFSEILMLCQQEEFCEVELILNILNEASKLFTFSLEEKVDFRMLFETKERLKKEKFEREAKELEKYKRIEELENILKNRESEIEALRINQDTQELNLIQLKKQNEEIIYKLSIIEQKKFFLEKQGFCTV